MNNMNWELVEIKSNGSEVDSYNTLKVYSFEDGQSILLAINEINELNKNKNLVTMIFENKKEFFDKITFESLGKFVEDSLTANGFDKEKQRKYYLNLNRLFLNFLSSIRTFLDHNEACLKRKFGKDSNQVVEFKKATNLLYENNFEYRFVYKLRNYCQHVEVPLEYSLSLKNDGEDILGELKIEFNPIRLLNSFDGWGEVVKKDLEKLSENFNCLPVIHTIFDILLKLYLFVDSLREDEIRRAAQLIKKETDNFRKSHSEICLIKKYPLDAYSGKMQVEMSQIPFYILDDLNV